MRTGASAPPKKKKLKRTATKCRSWILHPTLEQKEVLRLWFDGARFAYNLAAASVNETGEYDIKMLRERADVSTGKRRGPDAQDRPDGWKHQAPERLWGVPAQIRDSAVIDVQNACKALAAKEKTFHRVLKFRRSKDRSQSIHVGSRMLNCKTKRSLFAPIFGTTTDRSCMDVGRQKTLPLLFESDCTIVYERLLDRYRLCTAVEIEARDVGPETQGPNNPRGYIAAIDPGIRTFATLYDPGRERIVEWGVRGGRSNGQAKGTELLGWLTRKIGRLDRAAKSAHGRRRSSIRDLANRIRQRVQNLTDEMHHKLAIWLCKSFEVVLLPKFSPSKLSRRKGLQPGRRRVLCSNSVRQLAQMAPYRFRMYLLHKAREYGTRVVLCDEYYTSKTCTACGLLHRKLGANKTFVCPFCRVRYDRDAGAARNILLRYVA